MKRGNEENNHKTSSSSSTQRLSRRKISAGEKSGNVNIPLDLTVEILKKLPAKSLLRFQCVSKQWLSIISSRRDFIDSIVTRSLSQPSRDILISFSTTLTNSLKQISSSFPLRTLDILTKNQCQYFGDRINTSMA